MVRTRVKPRLMLDLGDIPGNNQGNIRVITRVSSFYTLLLVIYRVITRDGKSVTFPVMDTDYD